MTVTRAGQAASLLSPVSTATMPMQAAGGELGQIVADRLEAPVAMPFFAASSELKYSSACR